MMTLVRRYDSDDAALPSTNTCFHLLKLPPYSSKQVLTERLRYAIANSANLIDNT